MDRLDGCEDVLGGSDVVRRSEPERVAVQLELLGELSQVGYQTASPTLVTPMMYSLGRPSNPRPPRDAYGRPTTLLPLAITVLVGITSLCYSRPWMWDDKGQVTSTWSIGGYRHELGH